MDTLPNELLKLIALKIYPDNLLTVNKQLSSIYDEDYYCQYLTVTYPQKNLWKITTYKNLFLRAKVPRIAKLVTQENYKKNYCLILDFNGDLWWNSNKKIIDTHVTDVWHCINRNGYFKTGYSKSGKNGSIERYYVQKVPYEDTVVISNSDVDFWYGRSIITLFDNITSHNIDQYKDENGYTGINFKL
jgi:hypothetical protein